MAMPESASARSSADSSGAGPALGFEVTGLGDELLSLSLSSSAVSKPLEREGLPADAACGAALASAG